MNSLVVIAHPSPESLCRTVAGRAVGTLRAGGHAVVVEDLYASGFAPALTAEERAGYITGGPTPGRLSGGKSIACRRRKDWFSVFPPGGSVSPQS